MDKLLNSLREVRINSFKPHYMIHMKRHMIYDGTLFDAGVHDLMYNIKCGII